MIWDLAPHDLSIMDHMIKGEPEAIVATGERHLNGVEDVAFMTIYFPQKRHRAHQCELAFAGEDPDDADRRPEEDAGLERSGGGRKNSRLRQGRANRIGRRNSRTCWSAIEPATCGRRRWNSSKRCAWSWTTSPSASMSSKTPFNDGHAGLRVVRMLEAAEASIQKRGELVRL